MIYYNNFEFSFTWSGQDYEVDPVNLSFSVSDSIHSFYPKLALTISDITGFLQETMLTLEGTKLLLKYGIKDDSLLSCPFVFTNDELPRTQTYDSIGGEVTINGTHDYAFQQEILSKAYKGRISKVIQDVTANYNFNNANNIQSSDPVYWNDTGCEGTWYRPLKTQKQFIEDILLPNTYSNNSHESPFFCFISGNNDLYLRNYNSMIETTSLATLKMVNWLPQNLEKNVIMSIKRYRQGSDTTWKLRNRQNYFRDRTTGEYILENDSITSYPTTTKFLPILKTSLDTSYHNLFYKETETPLFEAFQGRQQNSMKDTLFLDKFILTVPLNCKLTAGKVVTLNLPIKNMDKHTDVSFTFNDNYLIEASEHVWNGKQRMGHTQLLVSRKSSAVSNTSYLKPNLFSGDGAI